MDGDIEYKGFRKEENFNEPPTKGDYNKVFNGIGESDSGSPVAAKFLVSGEKRRVIIAIVSHGPSMTDMPRNDEHPPISSCMTYGTKVGEDVVAWIKKLDSMEKCPDLGLIL